ncbi:lysylphosphatidylglycerol synthase transmembrane domain-containing protein [Jiangella asiatica]|uniref:Flippase-like domain-containing protein n=1 Tax=Jiangella asiatica TaxID=2530372 RepID=A0A4R5D5M6_9ACTN|nr:lysylphosphatidylglycerol synthase transmembrane domain-containing protein [Jiangella asiatica]TDE08779.1 flippase-like domain-containing protein [Jiangella asiatica]
MTETTEARPTRGRSTGKIVVDEPPLPRRTRRPIDGLRLLFVLTAMTALAALAVVAERTLTGLTADLADFNRTVPRGPVDVVAFASQLASLILPPALVFILMVRGRMRTTVELLVAGALASVAAALVSTWLAGPAPERLHDTFVPSADGVAGTAVPAMTTLLVAIVTVVSRLALKRIRQITAFAVAGSFAVWLFRGDVTVGGMLLSLGIGWAVGLLVRLVSGQPSLAPNGHKVAAVLRANGYDVSSLNADPVDKYRRYIADSLQGPLGVLVLDRDNDGAGAVVRAADQIRTREEVLPRQMVTMRSAVNQITLQSLAVSRAGARTPKLRNVLRIGSDAAAIVYDHVPGRVLANLTADEVTDAMLEDLWRQLGRLRRNQVAHRRISGRTILVSETGKVWLLDPSGGEVAAPELAIRADLAQALVGCALVVGVDRTIDTAIRVLGQDVVAGAIPLLQPVALARSTRRDLKGRRDVLSKLRDGLVSGTGREPDQPVRLQRLRPLSLVTGVGAVFAVYLVGTQLSDVSFSQLWSQIDWRWLFVAVVLMFTSFVGATLALMGFVPERVGFWRIMGAQISLGFLKLVAPATVGIVAINIRVLTKAGVAAPLAAASVAANQVGNVAITFPTIGILGLVTGSSAAPDIDPSVNTLVIVLVVLAAAAVLALIPPVRTRLRALWSDFAERGLPRLLDVLSNPRKLLVALGGILLQSASLILCFYTCLLAVGGAANIAALAVVQLVGNTLGMAVPTPGGLGAVEAALTAGVSTLGVGATTAVTAVLVFRLVSFWLPILPGWVLWTQMQKRDLL